MKPNPATPRMSHLLFKVEMIDEVAKSKDHHCDNNNVSIGHTLAYPGRVIRASFIVAHLGNRRPQDVGAIEGLGRHTSSSGILAHHLSHRIWSSHVIPPKPHELAGTAVQAPSD